MQFTIWCLPRNLISMWPQRPFSLIWTYGWWRQAGQQLPLTPIRQRRRMSQCRSWCTWSRVRFRPVSSPRALPCCLLWQTGRSIGRGRLRSTDFRPSCRMRQLPQAQWTWRWFHHWQSTARLKRKPRGLKHCSYNVDTINRHGSLQEMHMYFLIQIVCVTMTCGTVIYYPLPSIPGRARRRMF